MEMRLGDIIDDHCIKCRRLTNHSVVSLVEGQVAKVRCRSCYHEHTFLHEQAPPSRKELKKAELAAKAEADAAAGITADSGDGAEAADVADALDIAEVAELTETAELGESAELAETVPATKPAGKTRSRKN